MFNHIKRKLVNFKKKILLTFSRKTKLWKIPYSNNKKKLQIILYHNISPRKPSVFKGLGSTMHLSPEKFRAHIRFLKKHFCFIKPGDLDLIKEEKLLIKNFHKPPLLLTFDDGFKGVYEYALPICKELRVPFIVFVNSYFIDNQKKMWLFVISAAVQLGKKDLFVRICKENGYRDFDTKYDLRELIRKSINRFSATDTLKIVSELQKSLSSNKQYKKFEFDLFMTSDQIKELDSTDGYKVEDHGSRHLKLQNVNETILQEEVLDSKKKLENILGRRILSFSFPFARYGDTELNYLTDKYSFILIGGKGGNTTPDSKSWVLRRGYSVSEGDTPSDVITSLYF